MSQSQDLIKSILSLPPSVNPYEFVANSLYESIKPAATPKWLDRVLIFFSCLYTVQIFLGCVAIYYLIKDGRTWIIRTDRGIWLPNTRLVFVPLSVAFAGCILADDVWQVALDHGSHMLFNRPILESLRYVPFYWGGWVFGYGIIVQILLSESSGKTFKFLGEEGSDRRRWINRSVNTLFLFVPFANLVSVATPIIWGSTLLNKINDDVNGVISAMDAAAPTYNPATYAPFTDMIPLLEPLAEVPHLMSRFRTLFRAEWIIWCIWSCGICAAISPFVFRHLGVLRRLMGKPSVAAALFSRSSSFMQKHSMTASGSSDSKQKGEESNGNTSVHKSALHLAEYRRLAFVSFFVMLHAMLYVPLSIWLLCLDPFGMLQSAHFWAAQAIWSPGVFAIGGVVQHVLTIQTVRASLKARAQSNAITRSNNASEASSRRVARRRSLLPDETFVGLQEKETTDEEQRNQWPRGSDGNAVAEVQLKVGWPESPVGTADEVDKEMKH